MCMKSEEHPTILYFQTCHQISITSRKYEFLIIKNIAFCKCALSSCVYNQIVIRIFLEIDNIVFVNMHNNSTDNYKCLSF